MRENTEIQQALSLEQLGSVSHSDNLLIAMIVRYDEMGISKRQFAKSALINSRRLQLDEFGLLDCRDTPVASGKGWRCLTERNAGTKMASKSNNIPLARETSARSHPMTMFHAIYAAVHHVHELYSAERSATSLAFDILTGRPTPHSRSARSFRKSLPDPVQTWMMLQHSSRTLIAFF